MNLLTLRCEQQAALFAHLRLPLPKAMGDPREVVLGIRPEHLCLLEKEDAQGVRGTVDLVENLGMSRLLRIKVEGYDLRLRMLLPADQPWSGEAVIFGVPRDRLHWFDSQTQVRWG
ncbi:MAG: TOBE domain-containing protein [Acaryochloridaceae cyanobacterium SU_2_1]|nr:TOBE domain-containing protein [Acaryochloridaceae cyanobacterium SU_2_1]